jgi:hypothetical protein
MGKMSIFELFEDYILEAKRKEIKTIFYTSSSTEAKVQLQSADGKSAIPGLQTRAVLTLTACDDNGDTYLVHQILVGELITHAGSTEKDTQEYVAAVNANVDAVIKNIQHDYPGATLFRGSTRPLDVSK